MGKILLALEKVNETLQPIYFDWSKFRETHMQILGTTGVGKGVLIGMLIPQIIQNGGFIIVFDPKGDNWLQSICMHLLKVFGYPVHMIDVSARAPQVDPHFGTTAHEREELHNAAFDQGETGRESDIYKLREQTAAQRVASITDGIPLAESYDSAAKDNPNFAEEAAGYAIKLRQLCTLESIQTSEGLDIKSLMKEKGCLYITASSRGERDKRLMKMILVRCLQIIEGRKSTDRRHISLILDEFKHLLSKSALDALGMIRSKGCNVILAHQSLGDLRDCGALDPKSVEDAAIENTGLKVVYRQEDPRTADIMAAKSGDIIIEDMRRSARFDHTSTQRADFDGEISETERPLIPKNVFLRLPNQVAAIFMPGDVKIGVTAPFKCEKRDIELTPAKPLDKHGCSVGGDGEELI